MPGVRERLLPGLARPLRDSRPPWCPACRTSSSRRRSHTCGSSDYPSSRAMSSRGQQRVAMIRADRLLAYKTNGTLALFYSMLHPLSSPTGPRDHEYGQSPDNHRHAEAARAANPGRAPRADPGQAARRDDPEPARGRIRGNHDATRRRAGRRLAGGPDPSFPPSCGPRRCGSRASRPAAASPSCASWRRNCRRRRANGSPRCSICCGPTTRARSSPCSSSSGWRPQTTMSCTTGSFPLSVSSPARSPSPRATSAATLVARPEWTGTLLLALSAIRGLALGERFEPHGERRRAAWPELRLALLKTFERTP